MTSTQANHALQFRSRQFTNRWLLAYFVVVFIGSWTLWGIASTIPVGSAGALRPLLFLPGTILPGVVALVFAGLVGGRGQTNDLAQRMLIWSVPLRWYILAAGYMVGVKLIVAVAYRLMTGSWPELGTLSWFLPFAIAASTVVQAGEELGWRGVALPELAQRVGLAWASVVTGLIWAAWHYPLFIAPSTDLSGQPLLPFVVAVTALAVPMAWLYVGSGGSLLLVMLMHAAANNTAQLVSSTNQSPPADAQVAWLTAATLVVVALILLPVLRRYDENMMISIRQNGDGS